MEFRDESDAGATSVLSYARPARSWTEALPLGNGSLGAMVFGGPDTERLALNEGSLWSGGPKDWDNPGAASLLPLVRRAVLEGRYQEADSVSLGMQGPFTQSFLPLGDLWIDFEAEGEVGSYRRELDLDSALASVAFEREGAAYRRLAFASHPDSVLILRLETSRPGSLCFGLRLTSQLRSSSGLVPWSEPGAKPAAPDHGPDLCVRGIAPSHVEPSYRGERPDAIVYAEGEAAGMAFEARLRLLHEGGSLESEGGALRLRGAGAATLLLSCATGFQGFDRAPRRDPSPINAARLATAEALGYEALLERHLADHRALYRRVSLWLGAEAPPAGGLGAGRAEGRGHAHDGAAAPQQPDPAPELALPDSDERVGFFSQPGTWHEDPRLAVLLFNYGRYLLIASSRPGGQPANLQGLWNESVRPPWSSNYTINVNLEMNYWPAEPCNLAECHLPLLDFVEELSVCGARTARTNYASAGWVAHHNSDLWRQSAPVGDYGQIDPLWSTWPMGGVWLCAALWERFEYGGDLAYLRVHAYPVMKGAAEFCLDWLVEDGMGRLTTAPSISPELRFVDPGGGTAANGPGATMDRSLIDELFDNTAAAARLLGLDAEFAARLDAARARLLPYRIGSRGQLQEWSEDFVESEPRHRHLSQLYALYPGEAIDPWIDPALARAARRSLELRGDASTGWSLGWKLALWSTLGEGDRAYDIARLLFRLVDPEETRGERGGLYPNLFDAHPPFQIDGNFAFASGLASLLLQSRRGELRLLPALPSAWPEGEVQGLKAKGGFEVDLVWTEGRLAAATIHSHRGGHCRVRSGIALALAPAAGKFAGGPRTFLEFDTEPGRAYTLR